MFVCCVNYIKVKNMSIIEIKTKQDQEISSSDILTFQPIFRESSDAHDWLLLYDNSTIIGVACSTQYFEHRINMNLILA